LAALKNFKYIIRKRAMGDVLWIEPVISVLAESYDSLIVHTKFNTLFENYPKANVFFKNKLSFLEKLIIHIEKMLGLHFFSINLDNAYEQYPLLHFLNAYQQKAKLPLTREYPKLYLSDSEKRQNLIQGKYIVIHLESFSDKKFRQVFGIDWPIVVKHVINKGFKVVQIGTKTTNIEGTIALKTSIRELISVITHAHYFLGIDSGPSHIAASLKVPSLIIFGSLNPLLRHFPEKFNGLILKQSCNGQCTSFDVKKESEHHCASLTKDGIPKCCLYKTSDIISKLDELIKQNA
jgi:ADP-heptose:LPS heptosyltransferase